MIGAFRHFLNSWAARVFFLLLVGVFIAWGVGGDVLRMLNSDTAVAIVGSRRIEMPEAADAYRRQLAAVTRSLGTNIDPTPQIRQAVAGQALQALIVRAALENRTAALGIVTPDDALRAAVFAMPAFKGPAGTFDKAAYEAVLRNNNYTEATFLALLRAQLSQGQLFGAARAGTASPDTLTRAIYAFQHETRVADAVSLPFATAPRPADPTQAELDRWYANHKDLYSTPERRRVAIAILSADSVAKDISITDADLQAAWAQDKSGFQTEERRSVQVIVSQDEAKAKSLAAAWSTGTSWAEMQAQAQAAGASAIELPDATRAEFPAPELADAVFAAVPDTVPPPVRTALGWDAFRVVKITPGGTQTFEQARPVLEARLRAEKAADLIDTRANKLDDTLAGGTPVASLPPDLGAAVVTATLDASGLGPDGKPVALPATDALRAAILAEAFRAKPGDAPRLIDGPHEQNAPPAYFAVSVESVAPPAPRPEAEVADKVRADWTQDAIRHAREVQAAALLTAVKGGQSLADAAKAAGFTVATLAPAGRATPTAGVPLQLVEPLFGLKAGEPTMVETDDGFMVATLATIVEADPSKDPVGYAQVRDALARTIGDDIQNALTLAIRNQANPKINEALAKSLAQPGE